MTQSFLQDHTQINQGYRVTKWKLVIVYSQYTADLENMLLYQMSEDLLEVKMLTVVFWIVMPCSLVHVQQCVRGTHLLSVEVHFLLKMEIVCSSKMLVTTYKIAQHHNIDSYSWHAIQLHICTRVDHSSYPSAIMCSITVFICNTNYFSQGI